METQKTDADENSSVSTKKPSIRRKTPAIRQTLTSIYRIAKSNPLLWHNKDKDDLVLQNIKLPPSVTKSCANNYDIELSRPSSSSIMSEDKNVNKKLSCVNSNNKKVPNELDKLQLYRSASVTRERLNKNKKVAYVKPGSSNIKQETSGQLSEKNHASTKTALASKINNVQNNKPQIQSKQRERHVKQSYDNILFNQTDKERVSLSSLYRKKLLNKGNKTGEPITQKKSSNNLRVTNKYVPRRSRSAERFDSKKSILRTRSEDKTVKNTINHSMEAINGPQLVQRVNISPIYEEARRVTFRTPSAYNRRSVAYATPLNFRTSAVHSSTPGPVVNNLQKRLNEWLRKRGKSLGSFHHLKCFDVNPKTFDALDNEENKENIELPIDLAKDESYENLGIIIPDDDKIVCKNVTDFEAVAKDALHDLLKLIQDGYPQEQCEAWLGKIQQKHIYLDKEPHYWECRAALEQSKGNITSAVECYRTAIVKGAEVQTVDESLELLLQKFSLLNISTEAADEESKKKAKIILDARNAFKSTIIQFAVQEKMLKKKDEDTRKKLVVVTPVRRSARLSMTKHLLSDKKLYSSLKEIENQDHSFKSNSFLSIRYGPQ